MSEGDILVARGRQGIPGSRLARLWRAPMAWWRDVPIADPVDRRNAPISSMVCESTTVATNGLRTSGMSANPMMSACSAATVPSPVVA